MKGITQNRINDVKDIDLIQYLLDRYPDRFTKRKNGTQLVYKNNKSLVIYGDHAYDFGEVNHAYKDSIYVEQMLSGCTFMEAVERLEVWKQSKGDCDDKIRLDLFDNVRSDIDTCIGEEQLFMIK
ncbi:MAG: hypothetical protein J6I68_05830 [Butyrivibrio sp.]|uniref:hypothetical protein n=1 Tax=Butyrivibrio sp. TaxID=28121 RepID=UPI001B626304|nr:hypothetical protein [Butyrivibrio sp.]MBP3782750.1 hypothetical protein [Butyrivibrio sp.]